MIDMTLYISISNEILADKILILYCENEEYILSTTKGHETFMKLDY
jgi:hypothetical protein